MRRLAAVAFAALTACSGSRGGPVASRSSTPPATPASAEAALIRAATAKTVAACPCRVHVDLFNDGGGRTGLDGVYDAASHSADLHDENDPKFRVRVVDGRVYLDPGTGRWAVVDFARVPKAGAPLVAFALADPRIAFAFAAHVDGATPGRSSPSDTQYDASYDVKAAIPDTGPWASLVGRLFPDASYYDLVRVAKDGTLFLVSLSPRPDEPGNVAATLWLKGTHVPGGPVTAPSPATTLDAAATG